MTTKRWILVAAVLGSGIVFLDVRDASTSSFHLAILVGAGLLLVGALVNAIGIRKADSLQRQSEAEGEAAPQAGA